MVSDQLDALPCDQARRVPMEFRAQAKGRCQRQNITKPSDSDDSWRPDIQIWLDEWVERVDQQSSFNTSDLTVVPVQIDWRVLSNSGVDEGVIRPVYGAGGWPMIPGSSIKGLFRRACPPARLQSWCGSPCASGALSPGILRFHGAWPADASWKLGLLDVAHPQQSWQVGFNNGNEDHSAFGLVSLYRPRLHIALSCTDPKLSGAEWEEIKSTLRRALRSGIGGRTCAGYGSSGSSIQDLLFQCRLEGQGPAAKLLFRNGEWPKGVPEFRPNMFRAGIRGMALRLFGGLVDANTAHQVVGRLFGSLSQSKGPNVGLLLSSFADQKSEIGVHGRGKWKQPIYTTSGCLQWHLARRLGPEENQELLQELLAVLHGLTMALGGFGRGWRRPDHRIFFPDYYKQRDKNDKPITKQPIGCHWEWRDQHTLPTVLRVGSHEDLARLLVKSHEVAKRWLRATNQASTGSAQWREVIHPDTMLIWTRIAANTAEAKAVHWFHQSRNDVSRWGARNLRNTALAGKMGQVGRIWNRLLPLSTPGVTPAADYTRATQQSAPAMARPSAAMARPGAAAAWPDVSSSEVWMNHAKGPFLESLVLFPEAHLSPDFIAMMNSGAGVGFDRLNWT
jgi:CRISPR-associated protein Cmr6